MYWNSLKFTRVSLDNYLKISKTVVPRIGISQKQIFWHDHGVIIVIIIIHTVCHYNNQNAIQHDYQLPFKLKFCWHFIYRCCKRLCSTIIFFYNTYTKNMLNINQDGSAKKLRMDQEQPSVRKYAGKMVPCTKILAKISKFLSQNSMHGLPAERVL